MREKIFKAIRSYEITDDHGFSKPLPPQQVWALTDLVLAAIQMEKEVSIQETKSKSKPNPIQLPPDFDCDT
jgi:hypothetical protein